MFETKEQRLLQCLQEQPGKTVPYLHLQRLLDVETRHQLHLMVHRLRMQGYVEILTVRRTGYMIATDNGHRL